ncbi:MAG: hypothetical protein ABSE06_18750 [Anaerolineaceae bacterium]
MGEIRARYGANSILNLSSAGSTGALHSTFVLLGRFLNLFGGCTHLTGSYSNGAASLSCLTCSGQPFQLLALNRRPCSMPA